MSLRAELDSALSSLELLGERISSLADGLTGTQEEDLALSLMDVERHLRAASRRLERTLRDLQHPSGSAHGS